MSADKIFPSVTTLQCNTWSKKILNIEYFNIKLWTNVIIKLLQFKTSHFMHSDISLMENIDLTNTREHRRSWSWVQGPFSPPGPVLIACLIENSVASPCPRSWARCHDTLTSPYLPHRQNFHFIQSPSKTIYQIT